MTRTKLVLFIFPLALACDDAGVGSPSPHGDLEISLKYGETYPIPGEILAVTFNDVSEDSRCPADLICIWPGNGQIELLFQYGRTEVLKPVNTYLEPHDASFAGYRVELKELSPYPWSTFVIQKEDYIVNLVLRKE